MADTHLRIGTRGSALALAQATLVRDALRGRGAAAELEVITTAGDRRAPDTAWGEGAFVTAIEDALLSGEIDVAVHSAKDIPTDENPRLTIAAFMERAPAGDVVVLPSGREGSSLADLPVGARVGTDSPRRTAFLRAIRPDLEMHPLHGNVDTRLRRLDEGQSDALVLAEAGLTRLGRADRIAFRLPPEVVPPAPGQGALAVQVRTGDETTTRLVATLDHAPTRRAVTLERSVLAASGGGCRAPIGAFASAMPGEGIEIVAGFARPDGSLSLLTRQDVAASDGDDGLVAAVLADLSTRAAEAARSRGWPPVLVTRAREQTPALALALVDRGFAPVVVPAIEIQPVPDALADAIAGWDGYDWVVITSANAAAAVVDALRGQPAGRSGATSRPAGPRWAAVGRATTTALAGAGIPVAFRPTRGTGRDLARELPVAPGERVLMPRSDAADEDAVETLRGRGAIVDSVIAYRTIEGPPASIPLLEAALGSPPAAVVFTSGSTVRGLVALADAIGRRESVIAIAAVCIGEPTADEARRHGFRVVATSTRQAVGAIADATAGYLRPQEVAS